MTVRDGIRLVPDESIVLSGFLSPLPVDALYGAGRTADDVPADHVVRDSPSIASPRADRMWRRARGVG